MHIDLHTGRCLGEFILFIRTVCRSSLQLSKTVRQIDSGRELDGRY